MPRCRHAKTVVSRLGFKQKKEKGEKKKVFVDDQVLLDIFERMAEDEREDRLAFRFVLGLILIRKRLFRHESQRKDEGGDRVVWLLRLKGSPPESPLVEMVNPGIGDDDILYGDSIRENEARENDSQRQRWLRRLRVNARGRDFTVNGMMYDVRTGYLYDFCGGLDDVEGKCVRTINRADEAFAADPTLMLRAIRVAARHGLQPTREILAATRAHAPAIRTASAMRVAGELRTLLSGGYAAESVRSLWETGLLEHVAPAHAQYLAKSVNPDSNFVARPLSLGPLESSAGVERESPSVRTLLEPKPWERRKSGSSTTDAGHDGRHRRASKRVSDATTDRLFERDPFFAADACGLELE